MIKYTFMANGQNQPKTPELNTGPKTYNETVHISVGKEILAGSVTAVSDVRDSESKLPGALLLPGYKRNRDQDFPDELTGAMTAACEGVILKIDLLGQGESSGELGDMTLLDHKNAALAARTYMINEWNVDPKRWGVMGTSLGGGIAGLLKQHTSHLLMQGFSDFPQEMIYLPRKDYSRPDFEAWRRRSDPSDLGLAAWEIKLYPEGVTIIESRYDEMVPRSLGRLAMSFARSGVYHFLEAGHTIDSEEERSQFKKLAVDWASSL